MAKYFVELDITDGDSEYVIPFVIIAKNDAEANKGAEQEAAGFWGEDNLDREYPNYTPLGIEPDESSLPPDHSLGKNVYSFFGGEKSVEVGRVDRMTDAQIVKHLTWGGVTR